MPALFDSIQRAVGFVCSTQVGPGRGAAIALTAGLIVLAAGQLRLAGPRERRPSA